MDTCAKPNGMRKAVVAAVAAVPLLLAIGSASAQYRNTNDSRALDANNRLGSGGYNSGKEHRGAPSGNDIVVGNVTGLNYFHGQIDYTDPRAFRGETAGSRTSNPFIRASGDAPSPDNPNGSYQYGG